MFTNMMCCGNYIMALFNKMIVIIFALIAIVCYWSVKNFCAIYWSTSLKRLRTTAVNHTLQGVHKVLHTLKIFISQKPHKVETLHFRQ